MDWILNLQYISVFAANSLCFEISHQLYKCLVNMKSMLVE